MAGPIERVLVVGLGSIGLRHARLVRELLPNARILSLRHRAAAPVAGIDGSVTTVAEALRDRPQIAVVANPATCHVDTALPLVGAGVHVLIEKPLADTGDRVAPLIAEAEKKRVVLMTGYNLRFLRSLQCFREMLAEKRVGRVLSVRAEAGQHLATWRPESDYRQTVSARAALGGGVLLELSHEIDYLRWLFGDVEWVSAIARRQSAMEIDVEDTAHMILGFAPSDDGPPIVASLNIDFIRHDATRTCTVIGGRRSRPGATDGPSSASLMPPAAPPQRNRWRPSHESRRPGVRARRVEGNSREESPAARGTAAHRMVRRARAHGSRGRTSVGVDRLRIDRRRGSRCGGARAVAPAVGVGEGRQP
jgi:predicted dehydrogenase